ncbi:MAG TPA: metalloregulator ArsR/SmtB family transcription factor [Rhodobacterales bacterium]|nr:metalloregulator ArsR/SmtB family transcription factor [Rhodobacterales bacterium]
MDTNRALSAFSALGQQTRLEAFRRLLRVGPSGLSVGELAAQMGVRDNTMSVALSVLAQAGLVTGHREGRAMRYVANMEGVRGLVDYLTLECCAGAPDQCAPLSGLQSLTGDIIMPDTKNVLFLCTGNSARSLIGEAILNREGRGRFRAYSAGSHPGKGPHPFTLDLLKRLNHDVSGIRSKDWAEFATPQAPQMDFVFTVCDKAAAEVCPIWPGQPMSAHWGVPDPVAATGNEAERRLAFSEAYRMLYNRISIFVNLPMATLDKMSLQQKLDEIGKTTDPS